MGDYESRERSEFNYFIDDMGVEDILFIGRKFTCYRSNGREKSRLERFLVSRECLSIWNASSQYVFGRNKIVDWGSKLFKTLDCWYEDERFEKLVKDV